MYLLYLFHGHHSYLQKIITDSPHNVHIWMETNQNVLTEIYIVPVFPFLLAAMVVEFTVPYVSVEQFVWHPTLSCLQ